MVSLHRWHPLHCWCCCYCSLGLDKALINIFMKITTLTSSTTLSMTWTSCWEMRFSKCFYSFSDTLRLSVPLTHHLHTSCFMFFQDTEEIKKLSPTEQRKKITEIVKKIDTNADNMLSAGTIISHMWNVCQDKQKGKMVTLSRLCFIHRGDHTMDSARLQKIRSGRCKGALPWVWHRQRWCGNMGGIQHGHSWPAH